jgi:hypothetical protein
MRNAMVQLCLVLIGVTSVHAVKLLQTASMHATILPAEGAENVWAVHGKDSIKMTGVDGEYYLSDISPGHWQVHVAAKKPYQNVSLEEVYLGPGVEKDLGEIKLKK